MPFLDLPTGQDPRFQPRNTCIHKGYASVAIIPIRKGQQEIIGTLQINAVKKDCFTPDIIHSLEQIASHISEVLMRKVAEDALRDSETTIHNLLNAIPDDLALINSGRLIIAVNESMAATLGQQPELLTGRAIGDFLTSSVLSETIDRIIDPLTDSGQIYFEEKQNDQWFETSVYPVTDRNGADVRIAIQSREITNRKYLEEELKKVGLSQTELNIEKFQILNDQIRNPLQVIRGYTSLDPSKYNDKINKQVEIIDNIVTQLDMGWLESEKVQQFLLKHSHHNNQSLQKQQREGGIK
jgi:PAS domain S-box-containing protein